MKKFLVLLVLSIFTLTGCCGTTQTVQKQPRKIGVQMYTFHKFTFEDSIPMLKKAGINGVGLTAGQKVSQKYPHRIAPTLNKEQRDYLKKLIKDNNLKIVSYGVYSPNSEAEVKKLCAFAKDMGIPIILTEAKAEIIPFCEKYAGEYGVKFAVHNHASCDKMNLYYNPEVVKNLIKDCKNVYACPDNGHWSRSGIDAVSGYKTLEGKIAILHFKDQKEFNVKKNQCVPFGTGALNMKAMLSELDRQGFDGYFLIEYEANWQNNLAEVTQCAEYLRKN